MSVEFRVLGTLEVWAGDRRVRLLGARQERLLAALLLDAGRVVPLTRLADAVWEESAPSTVARQVRNLVAALRRSLVAAGAPEDIIATERTGYAVRPGADQLDARRFERLVETARSLRPGDPVGGAAALRAALDLWRGDALAGMSSQLIRAGAAHWDERRLAVCEECLSLELELGRHRDVVAEIATLADQHPFRERFTELHMLALYRCGRQSEALDAYHRLRIRLRDELGLDPAADARSLNEAILRRDPTLDPVGQARPSAPVAEATVWPLARPAQLPAGVATFTGRDWYLKALDALVTGEDTARPVLISAIAGTAGVGKTALAVHWAHRAAALFTDGQLYVNLRGYSANDPVQPGEALAGFLRALGCPADSVPYDLAERASLYRSVLAERRVLVLLDNARSAEQVRPLLPGTSSCAVVVTSRDDLGGLVAIDDARPLVLDVLAPSEAQELLVRLIGARRLGAEPAEAAHLYRLCGGLPLALRVVAADLVAHPDKTLAEAVAALGDVNRVAGLALPGDPQASVGAAFDLSYSTLDESERRLFRLLGLLPGRHITVDGVAALAGCTSDVAVQVLDRLARMHLLDQIEAGRYRLHDLLQRYAADRSNREDSTAGRNAAVGRWFTYCLDMVDSVARTAYPQALREPVERIGPPVEFSDGEAALSWVDGELPNLMAAALSATGHDRPNVAWLLADVLRNYFWYRRNPVDWITISAAGVAAAEAADNPRAQAACEYSLGHAYLIHGRLRESIDHSTRMVELSRRADWPMGEAVAHNILGVAYTELGRLRLAADHHRRGLEVSEQLGYNTGIGGNLVNLGSLSAALGQLQRAADYFRRALALFRVDDPVHRAICLTNLGECEYRLGNVDAGIAHLTESLALTGSAGRPDPLVRYLLAEIHCDRGQIDAAADHVRDALADNRRAPHDRTEAYIRTALARTYLHRGKLVEAFEQYARALQLARAIRSPAAEAAALLGSGWAYLRAGAPVESAECARRSLTLARSGELRLREGESLVLLAEAALLLNKPDEATTAGREALDIHVESGYRLGEAAALYVLAKATGSDAYRSRAAALRTEIGAVLPEQKGSTARHNADE